MDPIIVGLLVGALALLFAGYQEHRRSDRRFRELMKELVAQINIEMSHVLAAMVAQRLSSVSERGPRRPHIGGEPMYVTKTPQARAQHLWRYENAASRWLRSKTQNPPYPVRESELVLVIDLQNAVHGTTVAVSIDAFKAQLLYSQSPQYVRRCLQEYIVRLIVHVSLDQGHASEKDAVVEAAMYTLSRGLLTRYAVVPKAEFLATYGDGVRVLSFIDPLH